MDKKKILIVSAAFFPDNSPRSYRTTELAKEFSLQGHDVTVYIPRSEKWHDLFEKEHKVIIEDLGSVKWTRPNFGKSKIGDFVTRALSRGLQLLFEYPSIELLWLVKRALKEESDYDLLISIAVPYPIHWGVAASRKRKHQIAKTWIADCGDPYVGCETDTFRKLFYFRYVEKWFMRKADYITIPVESARSAYFPEFHKKIKIIPQGFKIKPNENIKHQIKNKIPTFIYAGGFLHTLRNPRPLLEYLSTLDIEFRFIVYTNMVEFVNPYAGRLKNKLEIRPYIPRVELLQKLSEADFLINFDNNSSAAVPSKLIDYVIAGRPVLNVRKQLDLKQIDEFLAGDYSNSMKLKNVDEYRIENVCRSFLALLN